LAHPFHMSFPVTQTHNIGEYHQHVIISVSLYLSFDPLRSTVTHFDLIFFARRIRTRYNFSYVLNTNIKVAFEYRNAL
jgi:hypothetical protein